MRERGHGHFVVVGSLTALVPFPGNATYAATKAALLAFVRSLRLELSETDLHAGIVLPGYTRTAMTEKKESLLPRMEADEVAVAIERCIEEQRAVVVPGKANQLSALLFRVFPDLGERIVASIGDYLVPG
jgi:short-subunit dehydrogenase